MITELTGEDLVPRPRVPVGDLNGWIGDPLRPWHCDSSDSSTTGSGN
jgi:hypothetical protein